MSTICFHCFGSERTACHHLALNAVDKSFSKTSVRFLKMQPFLVYARSAASCTDCCIMYCRHKREKNCRPDVGQSFLDSLLGFIATTLWDYGNKIQTISVLCLWFDICWNHKWCRFASTELQTNSPQFPLPVAEFFWINLLLRSGFMRGF